MASDIDFENLKFDSFNSSDTFLDNLNDPDFNLFNENLQKLKTQYFLPAEVPNFLQN